MTEPQAGRELDVLVAEKIMGLSVRRGLIALGFYELEPEVISEGKEPRDFRDHAEDYIAGDDPVAHYSTHVADAWQVVDKLPAKFALVKWMGGWSCSVGDATATADTAPLAICRAAIAAVSPPSLRASSDVGDSLGYACRTGRGL